MVRNTLEAIDFLKEYGYDASETAVSRILNESYEAKANLRSMFRHHPNWSEEQDAIIFTEDFKAGINTADIVRFTDWVMSKVDSSFLTPKVIALITSIQELDSATATESFAEIVNEVFPDIKAVVGQKTSRIINKIGKALNLTEIKEMREIYQNGEYREKDFGWNYYFAMVADAINPVNISKYTVISINPFDYWTMSFGKGWASCHTIDKEGVRGYSMNGNHTYEGCYSGGTESYMLDNVSVVFYTVDKGWDDEMWKAPKDRRMMFHIPNGDELVFGRLYPDGRDGGETGLAAQFRKCVQKILSECTNEINLWDTKKGTQICREWVDSIGPHYRDYTSYSDCGISFRKGKYGVKFVIGSKIICPTCNGSHYNEKSICCESCSDEYEYHCENCGCGLNDGDGWFCEDNDCMYCDLECAEADDVHYCENDGCIHTEYNCFYDDWTERYYYGSPDVVTEDGECAFYSEENARAYGYICVEGRYGCEWIREEDACFDAHTGEAFSPSIDYISTEFGEFINEENAEAYGLVNVDGEWVKEEEEVA